MDSLCSDLLSLISQFQSATEYCLVYNQYVDRYIIDNESIEEIIVTKNWKWLNKLLKIDNDLTLDIVKLYICAWGDDEVQKCQKYYPKLVPDVFCRLLASTMNGNIELFKLYADPQLPFANSGGNDLLRLLYHAIYYNNTHIIDEYFRIYDHIEFYGNELEHYIFQQRELKILSENVTYETINHLWTIMIRKNIVNDVDHSRLKQKLFSAPRTDGFLKVLINRIRSLING